MLYEKQFLLNVCFFILLKTIQVIENCILMHLTFLSEGMGPSTELCGTPKLIMFEND